MKQVGAWHVGSVGQNKRRALCRTSAGACYSVTQARGGGPFTVTKFVCSAEVFARMLLAGGDPADQDAAAIEVHGAMEVPDGLVEALLS